MDINSRVRIPTPEILKDINKESAGSEKTLVSSTIKRGKKRKLSTVGDAGAEIEVSSLKKATKKSKVKRREEDLASISQQKGEIGITGVGE